MAENNNKSFELKRDLATLHTFVTLRNNGKSFYDSTTTITDWVSTIFDKFPAGTVLGLVDKVPFVSAYDPSIAPLLKKVIANAFPNLDGMSKEEAKAALSQFDGDFIQYFLENQDKYNAEESKQIYTASMRYYLSHTKLIQDENNIYRLRYEFAEAQNILFGQDFTATEDEMEIIIENNDLVNYEWFQKFGYEIQQLNSNMFNNVDFKQLNDSISDLKYIQYKDQVKNFKAALSILHAVGPILPVKENYILAGAAIAKTADATIDIVKGGLEASFTSYAGFAVGTLNLMQSLGYLGGGEDQSEQAIMSIIKSLGHIQDFLYDFRAEQRERFEQIDKKLNRLFELTLEIQERVRSVHIHVQQVKFLVETITQYLVAKEQREAMSKIRELEFDAFEARYFAPGIYTKDYQRKVFLRYLKFLREDIYLVPNLSSLSNQSYSYHKVLLQMKPEDLIGYKPNGDISGAQEVISLPLWAQTVVSLCRFIQSSFYGSDKLLLKRVKGELIKSTKFAIRAHTQAIQLDYFNIFRENFLAYFEFHNHITTESNNSASKHQELMAKFNQFLFSIILFRKQIELQYSYSLFQMGDFYSDLRNLESQVIEISDPLEQIQYQTIIFLNAFNIVELYESNPPLPVEPSGVIAIAIKTMSELDQQLSQLAIEPSRNETVEWRSNDIVSLANDLMFKFKEFDISSEFRRSNSRKKVKEIINAPIEEMDTFIRANHIFRNFADEEVLADLGVYFSSEPELPVADDKIIAYIEKNWFDEEIIGKLPIRLTKHRSSYGGYSLYYTQVKKMLTLQANDLTNVRKAALALHCLRFINHTPRDYIDLFKDVKDDAIKNYVNHFDRLFDGKRVVELSDDLHYLWFRRRGKPEPFIAKNITPFFDNWINERIAQGLWLGIYNETTRTIEPLQIDLNVSLLLEIDDFESFLNEHLELTDEQWNGLCVTDFELVAVLVYSYIYRLYRHPAKFTSDAFEEISLPAHKFIAYYAQENLESLSLTQAKYRQVIKVLKLLY